MNKSLYSVVILLLILASCGPLNRKRQNNDNLPQIVKEVIAGTDTTSPLAVLRDKEIPPADNPNSITEQTLTFSGTRYYTILAEYPDPYYNRFAIIDTNYNVLLIDKSLNGYLTESKVETDHLGFIKVEESFRSKSIFQLRRVSFYSVDDNGEAQLVFRTFTELRTPLMAYKQDIVEINQKEIKTKIYSTVPGMNDISQDHDIFLFDMPSGKYQSTSNVFDDFVLDEVDNTSTESNQPQIVSRESYLRQHGISPPENKTPHKLGNFSMPLSEEWHEVKNVKIIGLLKHPEPGIKYINNHYGAEISVIQLPPDDSAESYISYPLENVSAGNYRVRFSEKVTGGKYFYQFFEYSCGKEKFLLILQTLKTTYDQYKDDYQNLINSFSMDC